MEHDAVRRRIGVTIAWLVPLVLAVNLAVFGLLVAYSYLNFLPDLPATHEFHPGTYVRSAALLVVVAPAVLSVVFLWPFVGWLRRRASDSSAVAAVVPAAIAQRGANAPVALAAASLLGWLLLAALVAGRVAMDGAEIPPAHVVHFISRPALAGLIAATATYFAVEHVCRARMWTVLLAATTVADSHHLWRVRVWHRLLGLWLIVGALPLGAVALTTLARLNSADATADPMFERLAHVVLLIALSAAVGGAVLAWLAARSITGPLATLEAATARLSAGGLDTRVPVNTTDEFGTLAEGFNLAAQRLSHSYTELETRNRELALALDRVEFLEHVKRGLDRFVPDTVRRAIEQNPQAPGLGKKTQDLTVLFLDIEGYTRLTEVLPRTALNALVERYFSLFLAAIRAQGGDINETAGDGLMIIFQNPKAELHARAAVNAALSIRDQTRVANRSAPPGQPPIAVNVGISSGECDVGATRFSGPAGERWTFTASGAATNLAARLGDHARNGQILLSDETATRVRQHWRLRSVGPLMLKNLSQPVQAWEIDDTAGPHARA
jgi:class 3 adenylate cyclase/HAMP domain-containing protein